MGADFYTKKLEYVSKSTGEKCIISLSIWDTAGQERYKSLGASFYRGADVCILVEDITRPDWLSSLTEWRSDFLNHANPINFEKFPFLYILNKCDLYNKEGKESLDEWKERIREKFDSKFAFLVSAKTGEKVEEVFATAAQLGLERANAVGKEIIRGDGRNNANIIDLNNMGTHNEEEASTCSNC